MAHPHPSHPSHSRPRDVQPPLPPPPPPGGPWWEWLWQAVRQGLPIGVPILPLPLDLALGDSTLARPNPSSLGPSVIDLDERLQYLEQQVSLLLADHEIRTTHTRGLAAAAAPLNLPARPAGMSLVQWIGIIQAILATIQPFLQPQGGPAK